MNIQGELASLQRISDRLVSTPNEELQKVLENLLPKLLPLSNNAELRDKQVVPILMQILKRIKLLEIRLPLASLISLIRPDMLPFCCNLSTVFIDAAKTWHQPEQWRECTQPLMLNFGRFAAYSAQSNALCFYSLYCLRLMTPEIARMAGSSAIDILGDWLLDVSLAQPGIVKDSAGSIQPGLSAERLTRLTAKKATWSALDMKQCKLDLVDSLSKQWLPTPCAVAIAIIASCDADTDVATQAVFKMNGARSTFADIGTNPVPVLDLLLCLCLPHTLVSQKKNATVFVSRRTNLRISVKCAILRWICKEMQDQIVSSSDEIVHLVTETMKSSEAGLADATYSSHILELTALLVERLPITTVQSVASILLQCVKKALGPYASQLSANSASSIDSDAGIHTRESCYRIVDRISRVCPIVASADAELLVLLFRLLDCEDNRAIVLLYTALGGLRLAYQGFSENDADTVGAESLVPRASESSAAATGLGYLPLTELILRSRISLEPKKRLAAVQWARALFLWRPVVLETMALLADDANESVSQAVVAEFTSLRVVVSVVCKNSNSSRSEVLVEGSAGQKDVSENLNVDLLGSILNLLASSVLYHPEKDLVKHSEGKSSSAESHYEEKGCSSSSGAPRFIAIEELLHTAATGMRCLVSSTRGYDFNKDHFFAADPWPLIPQCNDASSHNESCTVKISAAQLSATITAVGQILTSLSSLKPSSESVLATAAKGAAQSKVALKTALLNAQTRRIIAASADLLHKCLLISADSAVLECSRSLLPQVLNILPTCYSDLSDPFSLASLSAMHSLKSPVQTQQSGSSADRVIRDEARNVGSLRSHLGQIIALSCQGADEYYITNLIRVLNHKLSKLSLSSVSDNGSATANYTVSDDSLTESDLVLIAGTITALGSTAEGISSWMNGDEEQVQQHEVPEAQAQVQVKVQSNQSSKGLQSKAIVDNICNLLLDTISTILNLSETVTPQSTRNVGAVKEPVIEKDRFGEIKIVALKMLKDFAARGLLKVHDKKPTGTTDVKGDEMQISSSPVISTGVSNTVRITEVFDYLVDNVKSFSQREASGVSNIPLNGRSTTSSKIAAAAIDVLSTACLVGVAEDFFWSTWELLLSFRLSRSETPLLRFALAEGLVRMSAVRVTPQSADLASDKVTTDGATATVGAAHGLCVLTRVLLGIVETAVADVPSLARSGRVASSLPLSSGRSEGIFDKSTACVLLLVLVRKADQSTSTKSVDRLSASPSPSLQLLPKNEIIRATELFLQLLRDKDAFVQDMSCAGLCVLFNSACHLDQKNDTSSSTSLLNKKSDANSSDLIELSLSDIVGREVIATLTREKRTAQAAGVAVAGESTSTSTEGDMARALESLMHQPPADGEEERRPPANNGGGNRGGDGAVAGGGGAPPAPVDPLAAATAAAAAELGLSPEAAAAVMTRNGGQRGDNTDNGFGVYTTACKVAKKTGDTSVVFAVLGLIQRDPSFGVGETSVLRFIYQAPMAYIDKEKIRNLLPSLFLAKHDPSPPVKALMKQLWDTLITAQGLQRLLITLQNDVINYLRVSLKSSQWREREAACSGLESFLPLRPWSVVKTVGESLWIAGMSVLDDVRDSTRIAAIGFMKVLSDQVLRACNQTESGLTAAVVDEAIALIMPILLDKGLGAPSQEVRGFTLGVLVKLIKSSRSSLKEWLVRLVAVLVECMSAMEPKTLQYMQFHTARLQISDEELENMRLKLSRQSPMQEALDACLQAIGERPVEVHEVTRALCAQLQSGVGLATRTAAVQSLSYLADNLPGELGSTEHGSKAFRIVLSSLINSPHMAVTLNKALLGGLGSLAKVVNVNVLAAGCEELISRYELLGRDDGSEAPVIASCLLQLVSRAGDRILDDCTWSRLLAGTYIGTYDTDLEARGVWTKLWPEVLSGSATGTKTSALLRVLPIVVKLVCALLTDLAWDKRKQAVAVIGDLTVSLSSQHLSPSMGSVVEALIRSVPGQIWSGQAVALESLSAVVGKCFLTGNVHFTAPETTLLLNRYSGGSTVKGEREGLGEVAESKTSTLDNLEEVVITLEDAIIKKTPLLPSTTSATVDTASIALTIELAQSSYFPISENKSQTSPADESENRHGDRIWSISLRGLIALLLHESRRGDREYRLSAAKALSTLPWTTISSVPEGRVIFSEYVAEFALLGGVAPPTHKASELSGTAATEPSRSQLLSADKSDSNDDKKKKPQTNSALFGSRYGIDFKEKKATVTRRSPSVASSAPVSDVHVESYSRTADGLDINEDAEMTIDDISAEQGGDASHMQQRASDAPLTSPIVIGEIGEVEAETVAAGTAMNTAVFTSSHTTDPAYRVKFMDCISIGWPAQAVESMDSNQHLGVNSSSDLWTLKGGKDIVRACDLIEWAITTISSGEVWSIRVSALQILGAVLSTWSMQKQKQEGEKEKEIGGEVISSDIDIFLAVVKVITAGVKDTKHSKIRIAALACLNKLLSGQGSGRYLLDREEVRLVLRSAADDKEPSVLEAASKAQKSWLALNAPKGPALSIRA